jgi:restriction system protein
MVVPTFDCLFNPLLKALHELGGSASIPEMEDKVAEILNLTEQEVNEIHRGNRTKLSYRLAWARTYLKNYGLINNSEIGIWSLTSKGSKTDLVDKEEVKNYLRNQEREVSTIEEEIEEGKTPEAAQKLWSEELLADIMKLSPASFERLCQRVLRESGFVEVKVTGRSGDGGIDGRGIFKLGGLLSFHVVFQAKRWSGNVSSKEIRDFRGGMDGRADKGLFITTGTFTRDAKLEASRDGAIPIDLIDWESLVEKMKELRLGVKVKKEEKVEIDHEWFNGFENTKF